MKRRVFLKTVGSAAGVAALSVPRVFVLDKTIDAAWCFKPLNGRAAEQLQQMAANRESIFLNEEKQVAVNHPHANPSYSGSAHGEMIA